MALTDIPDDPPPPPKSIFHKLVPFTTVAMLIAMLYAGWTLYSRHQDTVKMQQEIDEKKQAARKKVVEQVFGSGEIMFSNFSAGSGQLKRGETTQLCYGVVNARSLKLDPPVEAVKPSYRHCLEIAPKKTTTYTITADDGAGHTKSLSLEVKVH
ncbi:MAG TPA: hypothetical protein VK604_10150 [Bryobacteraceae bacterium]|nr:hypothetical protein [Bryobacteraceae bacterium]